MNLVPTMLRSIRTTQRDIRMEGLMVQGCPHKTNHIGRPYQIFFLVSHKVPIGH